MPKMKSDMVIIFKRLYSESNDDFTFTYLGILTSHMKKAVQIHLRIILSRAVARHFCLFHVKTVTVLLLRRKVYSAAVTP